MSTWNWVHVQQPTVCKTGPWEQHRNLPNNVKQGALGWGVEGKLAPSIHFEDSFGCWGLAPLVNLSS